MVRRNAQVQSSIFDHAKHTPENSHDCGVRLVLRFGEAQRSIELAKQLVGTINQMHDHLRVLAQPDVGCALAGHRFETLISQGLHVEVFPKMLAAAKYDRSHGEMQLIDEPFAQALSDGSHTAANTYVAPACSALRMIECRANATSHEMKFGATEHFQGPSR